LLKIEKTPAQIQSATLHHHIDIPPDAPYQIWQEKRRNYFDIEAVY